MALFGAAVHGHDHPIGAGLAAGQAEGTLWDELSRRRRCYRPFEHEHEHEAETRSHL